MGIKSDKPGRRVRGMRASTILGRKEKRKDGKGEKKGPTMGQKVKACRNHVALGYPGVGVTT